MQTVSHAKVSAISPSAPQAFGSQVVVSNVSKSYGAGTFAKEVVHKCSFTIERGKLTVMIGPSGCGKSTLIRLVAGFERPSSGSITVDGKPVTGPGVDRLVVFQETALFPWMTTYDNIMYGPRASRRYAGDARVCGIAFAKGRACGLSRQISRPALWRDAAQGRIGALDDQSAERDDS